MGTTHRNRTFPLREAQNVRSWCVATIGPGVRGRGGEEVTTQERIKKDLIEAIKAKDVERREALRVVLGEIDRQDTKALTDEDVVAVLRRLVKSERETLDLKGESDSGFIRVVEEYLPQLATDDEIAAFIRENIDLSGFKNKMQAMGPIMKHFGRTADGNAVKRVLESM
jgi:uncharacterized protein YqeY